MRYHAIYKSLMLLLLLGFALQSQGLQAAKGNWFVAEGTNVVGKKHLVQAQKQATTIFIAKGVKISGAIHFSQTPLQEKTSVFVKPNTKLSNWEQVYRLGVTLQNTASLAAVQVLINTALGAPTSKKPQKNKEQL